MIRLGLWTDVRTYVCLLLVKRYSMALHAGELVTLSIFELLEYIVSEVSGCLHTIVSYCALGKITRNLS